MFPITDPILVFTILALMILVAPVFYEKWRIPDLVLLLGFGALLGPNGLHVLERSTAVTLLGAVGMIFIMFLAGLEIDLYRFSRSYKKSIVFGFLTFIIPQTLGTLAGLYVLRMDLRTSLLLASMFASHTLLAYPLAGRLGIARSEPVAIAVGATMITDTLALLVLAVIADSARGIDLTFGFWATIVFGMLGLTVLILKGVPFMARWFFQRVSEKSNAQFLFVMVVLCGGSYLSHFARVEPIVGAFLTGAAFNRLIPEHSPLMSRMTFAGHTLFIPFFLISVGMLVDFRLMLTGTRSWLVGATMVGTVVLTKYIAAQLAGKLFGYSRAAGQVMFGLSVVQAAATLAAVMIGHQLEIFDDAVLNGAIAMIVVSCPLGFWAVSRFGREMAMEAPVQATPVRSEQRLLVSVANPESAARLLDMTFLLRNTARPGGIYPLTVIKETDNMDEAVARGEALLGQCSAHAASADMSVIPELRVSANISDGMIQAARELRSSTVIMGWAEEHSASIRIFGTVMHNLVGNCPSRLLFCRLVCPLNTTKRVLVPFPAMALKLRDLSSIARDIKMLTHQAGAELRIYAADPDLAGLLALLKETKPSCRITAVKESSWADTAQTLFSEVKPDDLILLPFDRHSGYLWTPAMDHFPEMIADRFPQVNLLVFYPSMPTSEDDSEREPEAQDDEFPVLIPADITAEYTFEQALTRMTEDAFSGNPEPAGEAFKHLLNSAQSYPVELSPGIVLVHARCGDLEHPLIMVCHAPQGCPLPDVPVPPKILLVLLGAQSCSPEQHLRTLFLVAKRMHEPDVEKSLHSAQSAAELCRLLGRPGAKMDKS